MSKIQDPRSARTHVQYSRVPRKLAHPVLYAYNVPFSSYFLPSLSSSPYCVTAGFYRKHVRTSISIRSQTPSLCSVMSCHVKSLYVCPHSTEHKSELCRNSLSSKAVIRRKKFFNFKDIFFLV